MLNRNIFPKEKLSSLIAILKGDPRPAYQDDPHREYGFNFAGFEIRFTVNNGTLFVKELKKFTGC